MFGCMTPYMYQRSVLPLTVYQILQERMLHISPVVPNKLL